MKFKGVSTHLVFTIVLLIIVIICFINVKSLEPKGEVVDAVLIFATPSWDKEEVGKIGGFSADMYKYIENLSANEKRHLTDVRQTGNEVQIDSYMMIEIVDEESEYYGKQILINSYNEELVHKICSTDIKSKDWDVFQVCVVDDGQSFTFDLGTDTRPINGYLLVVIILLTAFEFGILKYNKGAFSFWSNLLNDD